MISEDVLYYVISPILGESTLSAYLLSRCSLPMYQKYMNLSLDEIGEWASTNEPWFTAIKNDDVFLFQRLLDALENEHIVVDGEVIDDIGIIDKVGFEVADIISQCREYNSTKIFSYMFNHRLLYEHVRELIYESQVYLGYMIGLTMGNEEDATKIVNICRRHTPSTIVIMEKYIMDKGTEGLKEISRIMEKEKVSIERDGIDLLVEYARKDTYKDREQVISLLESYPYTWE